jgi:hypothetical protein
MRGIPFLILCYNITKMLLIARAKIDSETRKKIAEDLKGYIKIVADVRRKVLAVGGEKHVDGERLLLEDGSRQEDLWGAGLDLETGEMDFDSLINLRPMRNRSREILDEEIRKIVAALIKSLLKD